MTERSNVSGRLLNRRQYIALVGASSVGLAGCSGGSGDDSDDGNSDDGSSNSGTQTQSATTPQTFSGSGQSSGETVSIEGGLVVTEASHSGSGTFGVTLGDDFMGRLVSANGSYDGAEARQIDAGEYTLNVTASGEWDVTIRQPSADSGASPPESYSGSGSDVVGPVDLSQSGTASFTHSGEQAVQVTGVREQGPGGQILFRSAGEFEDSTQYPSQGVVWIDIDADGSWTLEFE